MKLLHIIDDIIKNETVIST